MDPRKLVAERIFAVVLLTLALGYALALARLVIANQRALEAEAGLAANVEQLSGDVTALETAVTESGSDEAAERWARDHLQLAREGDHVIVPVRPTQAVGGAESSKPGGGDGVWQRLLKWLKGS